MAHLAARGQARLLAAALAAVLAVLAGAVGWSDPAAAADPSLRVAFLTSGNLHIANADGTNVRLVADLNRSIIRAVWSPDGVHIGVYDGETLQVVRSDGTGLSTVLARRVQAFRWAPDGTRLVAAETEVGRPLVLVGLDGSETAVAGTEGGRYPVWSPDGARLVFEQDLRVVAARIDGSDRVDLGRSAGGAFSYDWAPDSARVVARLFRETQDQPPTGLQIIDVTTGAAESLVATTTTAELTPRWSPDGTTIAYRQHDNDANVTYIYTIPATGGTLQRIDVHARDDDALEWSADNRSLLFVGQGPMVQVIDVDGTALTDIHPAPSLSPSWGPPGPVGLPHGGFDGDPATTQRADFANPSAAAEEVSRARFAGYAAAGLASHNTAAYAILSRDDVFADSLAGAPLSARGPLLFTPSGALRAEALAEVRRVLPPGGTVFLLGGRSAIGDEVETSLRDAGFQPRRLAGPTRVETAIAVADEVRARFPQEPRVALARSESPADNPTAAWADSVTGGAWGASAGVPILVTPTADLHPAVAVWLEADQPSETILFGGRAALSDQVEARVPSPRRIAGAERAETAARIMTDLWDQPGTGARRIVVIGGYRQDGWRFGLGVAGLAADSRAPLLLVNVDTVPAATAALVGACGGPQVDLLVAGSSEVVSDAIRTELDRLDGESC